jgi:8-oxo-dGTP diphosphatase
MQEYTCGFMFDRDGSVVLALKNKPAWQAGKLNGLGGKLEPGETPDQCMAREWIEETGDREPRAWDHFVSIRGSDSVVHFFRVTVDAFPAFPARTDVGEAIVINSARLIIGSAIVIPNLRWLIPLALQTEFRIDFPIAPAFDAMSSAQEALAISISAEICAGARPDAVQVLEWADALYKAEVAQ